MPAYLKVIDRCSADYNFYWFGVQSNRVPSPEAGFLQPFSQISVSLEAFYAN